MDYNDDTREDEVYIIVTVLKTKNNYELRMRKPRELGPNQVCQKLTFSLSKKGWFNRIEDATPTMKLMPPEAEVDTGDLEYGQTLVEKTIHRMR